MRIKRLWLRIGCLLGFHIWDYANNEFNRCIGIEGHNIAQNQEICPLSGHYWR